MEDKKIPAAQIPSVAADEGQPMYKEYGDSIAQKQHECNPKEMTLDDSMRIIERISSPGYMYTVSLTELYQQVFEPETPVIDGLLGVGVYLLCGAPKIGKSFLVAQLAYHVSTGTSIWGYPVRQGKVLYLALEDSFKRVRKRMCDMFGTGDNDEIRISTGAKLLGTGLKFELEEFVRAYPNTKMVIVDTLQRVRELSTKISYAEDYAVVQHLKSIAEKYGICVLCVHHTRKQRSDDVYDMISGTNGLLGAADGALVMHKDIRYSNEAVLDVTGRDFQDQRLYLRRDTERLTWELDHVEMEMWKEPPDAILDAIAELVRETDWDGSATQLTEVLHIELSPNKLSQHLNVYADRLYRDHGVIYGRYRTRDGRGIRLSRERG